VRGLLYYTSNGVTQAALHLGVILWWWLLWVASLGWWLSWLISHATAHEGRPESLCSTRLL